MTAPAIEIPGYVAGTWDIDPVHSHIGFVGRHMVVSKVRGHFDRFEGEIVTAEDPLRSSAMVTVDMSSVDTGNKTRDDDLRSDNFFAAAAHPMMSFRSTGLRRDGEDHIVDGELTVRGTTRPVSLTLELNGFTTDSSGATRVGLSARGEINRVEFGVCSNEPYLGLAGDKVHLDIEIGAVLRRHE